MKNTAPKPWASHDQLSTIKGVKRYKVKVGGELRTCACCSSGIRNVVVFQDIDLPDAKWELGKDCADTHATTSHGISGRLLQTAGYRFLSHEMAAKLRAL